MNYLAYDLGFGILCFALGVGVLFTVAWLASKSPSLHWLLIFSVYSAWGLLCIAPVGYEVFFDFLPNGDYLRAILSIAVNMVILIPWFKFALPKLRLLLLYPTQRGMWT